MDYPRKVLTAIEAMEKQEIKISLDSCDLTDDMIEDLSKHMESNTAMESLDLQGNKIGPRGAKIIAQLLLKKSCSISWLDIAGNQIGDEGVLALGEVLLENKSVKYLFLYGNEVSDDGVIKLCELLTGNTTLVQLELRSNKGITDVSLPAFKKLLQSTHITKLDLDSTSMSKGAKKDIKVLSGVSIEKRRIVSQPSYFRMPMPAPQKGSNVAIKPPAAIVTINEHMQQAMSELDGLRSSFLNDLNIFCLEALARLHANVVAGIDKQNQTNEEKDALSTKRDENKPSFSEKSNSSMFFAARDLHDKITAVESDLTKLNELDNKILSQDERGRTLLGKQRDEFRTKIASNGRDIVDKGENLHSIFQTALRSDVWDKARRIELQMMEQQNHVYRSRQSSGNRNNPSVSTDATPLQALTSVGKDVLINTTEITVPRDSWIYRANTELLELTKLCKEIHDGITNMRAKFISFHTISGSKMDEVQFNVSKATNNRVSLFSAFQQYCANSGRLSSLIEKVKQQIILSERREKIRQIQVALFKKTEEVDAQEILLYQSRAEVLKRRRQDENGNDAPDAACQELEWKLKVLQGEKDDILEKLRELCFDDEGKCLFVDLVPNISASGIAAFASVSLNSSTPLASSSNPNTIRIVHTWRIKPRLCTLLEPLGVGAFSQVHKILYQKNALDDKEIYAFKKFRVIGSSERECNIISSEIEILSNLHHPNIVRFIGASDDPNCMDSHGNLLGIGVITEYCCHGSIRQFLSKYNNKLSLNVKYQFILDTALGLEYLHKYKPNAILHRDLKSDNILIDKDFRAKICDFGVSKTMQSSFSGTQYRTVGTFAYKAPEAFRGEYDIASDIYAFGCFMYEVLAKEPPWHGLSEEQIMFKICVEKHKFDVSKIKSDINPEIKKLLGQCISIEKEERPNIEAIRAQLESLVSPAIFIETKPTDQEYLEIENYFYSKWNRGCEMELGTCPAQIVSVTRIRNDFSDALYKAEVENIKRELHDLGHNVNERFLFHGTSESDPIDVVSHRHGMMKDFNVDGFYGKGLYFAEFAGYSHEGFGFKRDDNLYELLICSVVCGNSKDLGQIVDDDTKKMSQKSLPKDFHSVRAGPHGKPGFQSYMYVIYKDSQVTPKYIVSYKFDNLLDAGSSFAGRVEQSSQ